MSHRQQLRRDRQRHRREQGIALLNAKVERAIAERMAELSDAGAVAPEASTPVNPPDSGVS